MATNTTPLAELEPQLRARLDYLRGVVAEYEQLTAVLAALESVDNGRAPAPKPTRRAATASKPSGTRAPRGQNKAAILAIVKDRPGVTAAEVSEAAGIDKTVVASAVSAMKRAGELADEKLPSGRKGLKLAEPKAVDPEPEPDKPKRSRGRKAADKPAEDAPADDGTAAPAA